MAASRTVKEVAEFLGISAAMVYGLCTKRKIRHIRLGVGRGTIRIPEDALKEFLAGATVQTEDPTASTPPLRKRRNPKTKLAESGEQSKGPSDGVL